MKTTNRIRNKAGIKPANSQAERAIAHQIKHVSWVKKGYELSLVLFSARSGRSFAQIAITPADFIAITRRAAKANCSLEKVLHDGLGRMTEVAS